MHVKQHEKKINKQKLYVLYKNDIYVDNMKLI